MVDVPWRRLLPPDDLSTADWTEANRVLSTKVAAEPGPMRLDRTPYVRGILDVLDQPHVREVWAMKCVQSALSETARSFLGARIHQDPAPAMIVFPNEQSAREMLDERIRPMLEDTPCLAGYMTGYGHDVKRSQINLVHMSIYLGWAGSPQALASRPIRDLVLDEVDKYPGYRGVEADSISLAIARTTTYRRSKVFGLSTPTLPTGNIAKRFDRAGLRYHYASRCQSCGEGMKPEWDRVRFEDRDSEDEDTLRELRAALESGDAVAVYVCQHCEHEHTHAEYLQAVREGHWVGEGHQGAAVVGFHVHGLLSPWLGVDGLAREYVKARLGGLEAMQHFYNSCLGIPFWDESVHGDAETQIGAATVWRKATAEPGVVPNWASVVVAGADSKKRGHYYVVRAFGPGWRSSLIDYGETSTSEELTSRVFRDWPGEKGSSHRVRLMCVDTGGGVGARDKSRSDELYRYCKSDPAHIKAVRGYGGAGTPSQPVVTRQHQYVPPGGTRMPYDITVSTLDVGYFKDLLAARINDTEDDDLWSCFQGVGSDYVLQLAAERKVLVERRIRHGESRDVWRWLPRTSGAANHYLDSECYALAAAYMLDVDRIEEGNKYRRRRRGRGGSIGWATNY